eukprot:7039182-Lingulodinium_polyedra.AAC.1
MGMRENTRKSFAGVWKCGKHAQIACRPMEIRRNTRKTVAGPWECGARAQIAWRLLENALETRANRPPAYGDE